MSRSMFMWRVGAIPVDVYMEEPGRYSWSVPGAAARHEACRHGANDWSLALGDAVVGLQLPSLRACVARSFEVPLETVKGQKSPTGG